MADKDPHDQSKNDKDQGKSKSKDNKYQRHNNNQPRDNNQPAFTFTVTASDPEIINHDGKECFQVLIKATVFKKNGYTVDDGQHVILEKGTKEIETLSTKDGSCLFTFRTPLSDHGQHIPLNVRLLNRQESAVITVVLPKKDPQTADTAERINLISYVIPDSGEVRLNFRVIEDGGNYVADGTVVNFTCRGKSFDDTVKDGHVCAILPDPLQCGEKAVVYGDTPNITGMTVAKIYRPRKPLTFGYIMLAMIKRVTFWLSFIVSFFSFFGWAVGTFMVLRIPIPERMVSGAHASDILWLAFALICFYLMWGFAINVLWFGFRVRMSKAIELVKTEVIYNRPVMASDSHWENIARWLENAFKPKTEVTVQNAASSTNVKTPRFQGIWETARIIILSLLSDIGFDWVGKLLGGKLKTA